MTRNEWMLAQSLISQASKNHMLGWMLYVVSWPQDLRQIFVCLINCNFVMPWAGQFVRWQKGRKAPTDKYMHTHTRRRICKLKSIINDAPAKGAERGTFTSQSLRLHLTSLIRRVVWDLYANKSGTRRKVAMGVKWVSGLQTGCLINHKRLNPANTTGNKQPTIHSTQHTTHTHNKPQKPVTNYYAYALGKWTVRVCAHTHMWVGGKAWEICLHVCD